MKFTEYISTTPAFTTEMLREGIDSPSSVPTQLNRAIATGAVERVRRGLYVSHAGKYIGAQPDPYLIVSALDSDAVLSYHSALEALGVAHNVGFTCSFRTDRAKSPFIFSGTTYIPYPKADSIDTRRLRGGSGGEAIVTTKEQTTIDCLKHPSRAGGIEEAVRSVTAFNYLDADKLARMAANESASVAARIGWLLELKKDDWRVSDETLEALEAACSGVGTKLDTRSKSGRSWVKRWSLTLPDSEEEVASWIS